MDPTGHFSLKAFLQGLLKSGPGLIVGAAVAAIVTCWMGCEGLLAFTVGGVAGGAAAGGINTITLGGSPLKNIGVGALLGGIGGAIGPPLVHAAGILGASVTGAVVGAVGAALYGGNVLNGIIGVSSPPRRSPRWRWLPRVSISTRGRWRFRPTGEFLLSVHGMTLRPVLHEL